HAPRSGYMTLAKARECSSRVPKSLRWSLLSRPWCHRPLQARYFDRAGFDAGWRCARLGHPPQVRLGVATGHSATTAAPAGKRRQPTSASVAARLPRPTPSGRSPALLNNLVGAHQHPPGPTHPRAASVIPSPPFTAAAAADRATPSEGAALTSKP